MRVQIGLRADGKEIHHDAPSGSWDRAGRCGPIEFGLEPGAELVEQRLVGPPAPGGRHQPGPQFAHDRLPVGCVGGYGGQVECVECQTDRAEL